MAGMDRKMLLLPGEVQAASMGGSNLKAWQAVATNVWKEASAIVLVDIGEGPNQMDVKSEKLRLKLGSSKKHGTD